MLRSTRRSIHRSAVPSQRPLQQRSRQRNEPLICRRPLLEPLEIRALLAAGSLDPSFSGDGILKGPTGNVVELIVQSDRKTVLTNGDQIYRYRADGSLDPSFAGDGSLDIRTPIADLALVSSNRFFVLTQDKSDLANKTFSILRYNSTGALDKTWGNAGRVRAPFHTLAGYGAPTVQDFDIAPDGKIVVAGEVRKDINRNLSITRLNANGTVDTSFNRSSATGEFSIFAGGFRVESQNDGKVLLGYTSGSSHGTSAHLQRLGANGAYEDGFRVQITNTQYDSLSDLDFISTPAGPRILVTARSSVVRLHANGNPDLSFGTEGAALFADMPFTHATFESTLDAQGRIVTSAFHDTGEQQDNVGRLAIHRLTASGQPDTSFANGSSFATVPTPSEVKAYSPAHLAIGNDGKITPAGATAPGGSTPTPDIYLARFQGTSTAENQPFRSSPFAERELIQAEQFDRGGQNIAYFDDTSANIPGAFRPKESVDIASVGKGKGKKNGKAKGYVVNNANQGEWLEYTIFVPTNPNTPRPYTLVARYATPKSNAKIEFSIDEQPVASLSLRSTGSYKKYATAGVTTDLAGGRHVLRVRIIDGGANAANFDWFRFIEQ